MVVKPPFLCPAFLFLEVIVVLLCRVLYVMFVLLCVFFLCGGMMSLKKYERGVKDDVVVLRRRRAEKTFQRGRKNLLGEGDEEASVLIWQACERG